MEYAVLKSPAILLTLFTLNSYAMENDNSDSSPKKTDISQGLTLKEAQDYFYDKYKYHPWEFCGCYGVLAVTGYTAATATGVLMPIGGALTGIYCNNFTNYMSQQNNCNNLSNSAYQACLDQYPLTPTPHDPICQLGIAFLSTYGLTFLSFICSWPITKIQRYIAGKLNDGIKQTFKDQAIRGYTLDDKISLPAMRFLSPHFLDADETLLKKLSVDQAMVFAEVLSPANLQNFAQTNFSENVSVITHKLSLLLQMGKDDLVLAITNEQLREWFREYPSLLEALIRLLPKDWLFDDDLMQSLDVVLGDLLRQELTKENLAQIIDDLNKGNALSSITALSVVVEREGDEEDRVFIKYEGGGSFIDKDRLAAVSEFFASREKLPVKTNSQEVDLTQIKPVWVKILIDEAMGDVVSINNQKIIDILEAAIYFGIDSLFKRWDNYIFEKQLLLEVLKKWKKTSPEAINVDIDAPIEQYKFCCKYSLINNKNFIVKKILESFNDMVNINYNLVGDLKMIKLTDIEEVIIDINFDRFLSQLKKPEFLRLIWQETQDIEFIKKMIKKFCQLEGNQNIVNSAWVIVPEGLGQPIQ